MLCLLQQAKQIYQLHYTAIQQSRERWDSHFKTEVCFNYTYIFSKGRNKTESRRLDRRDWPCFSDPLLYEEERKETSTTLKKLLKKLKPPSNNHSDNYSKKVCESESETSLSLFISFSIFWHYRKHPALYTAIYIVYLFNCTCTLYFLVYII